MAFALVATPVSSSPIAARWLQATAADYRAKAARTAKLRLSADKNQPPTLGIAGSGSYRRVQLAVNGNEVTTLPLPSTNVAVPSIDSSFREGLRVIGPT